MTRARLADLRCAGRPILADGAMGTSLQALGLSLGEAPERWSLEHPDRVMAVHQRFVDAGASILVTNTFGPVQEEPPFDAITAAVAIAATVAEAAPRPVVVAGCVGPAVGHVDGHVERLAAAGVDVVWIETMLDAAVLEAAVRAAIATGLPYVVCGSFSVTSGAGRLTPAALWGVLAEVAVAPAAIGANCGDGPSSVVAAVSALAAGAPTGTVIVAKASAGLPALAGDRAVYPCTPADMAAYARHAVHAGASIVGGCCGTSPAHLRAIAAALQERPPAA